MKVYDQHRAAFRNVCAYVVVKDGERVATIAFRYPRDGAGRLYAYVHWLDVPMVRGFASGGGYDKHSAAIASAIPKMLMADAYEDRIEQQPFIDALRVDGSSTWGSALHRAGFTVWQAV